MEISKERIRSLENQLEKSESERSLKIEKEIDREIKQNEQSEQSEQSENTENTENTESTESTENTENTENTEHPEITEGSERNESNIPFEQTDQSSITERNDPQSTEPQPASPSPSALGPPQPDHPPESEPDEESAQQIDELNKRINELTSQLEEAKQINLFCFLFVSHV